MEENHDIIIFLKDGKTLRFENISAFDDTSDDYIGFVYQGVSTGKERVAIFCKDGIAGYGIDSNAVETID